MKAKSITPTIINLLEALDAEIKNSKKLTNDLDLAKEGFLFHPQDSSYWCWPSTDWVGYINSKSHSSLNPRKNDCDSQREARRLAQERHLTIEDELDLEKIYLKSTIEDQKTKMFYLESRAQNYDYIAKQAKDSFLFIFTGVTN